ncbi:phosphoethanolamine transferase [Chitinibacteraceae bacterium HSL-7]
MCWMTSISFVRGWMLAPVALVLALALGYDGRRLLQLLLLAALLLPLAWPAGRWRGARALLAALIGMAFIADGVVRAYLLDVYRAHPGSSMILTAVANTHAAELHEYLQMYARQLAGWSLGGLLLLAAWLLGLSRLARLTLPWPAGGARVALIVLLVLSLAAHAVKPWRRLHPLQFWPGWFSEVAALKAGWQQLASTRARWLTEAQRARVTRDTLPTTAMLVITDSVNRDNFGLYGYARATTPALSAWREQSGGALLRFAEAWSADASTVPALRNFFHLADPARRQHLLALARAGGYHVWWIGNHDDLAIEQEHALLANHVRMVNQTPGRSSAVRDSAVLGAVRQALRDPAPNKLIVVHLLGAHPHYALRYGPDTPAFGEDAVSAALSERPAWVRALRDEYDRAILYHDGVAAQLLGALASRQGRRVWLYASDHGQNVGHDSDDAGHSPETAAGYRVPVLLWHSDAPHADPALEARPVRGDWLGWSTASLLGLSWSAFDGTRDVLSAGYRWEAPRVPGAGGPP